MGCIKFEYFQNKFDKLLKNGFAYDKLCSFWIQSDRTMKMFRVYVMYKTSYFEDRKL